MGDPQRDALVGTVLDRRFRMEERVAAGGFGAIYRATHLKSGYRVAIKVLHPHMSRDARVVARFRREGQALTTLRDPHTVTTYELAEDADGTLFIVMELLAGETLHDRLRARGRLAWREVAAIARQVCDALAEAHAIGIVHRDLKPSNIMLVPVDGALAVKVLDFGIAKLLSTSELAKGDDDLTRNNEVVGTYEYVSPEQIRGSAYSGRADLYTLGVVMYEAITGARPFAESGTAALIAILNERAAPASSRVPAIPRALDRAIARCLEIEPDDRFADAAELAAALDDVLAQRSQDPDDDATAIMVRPPSVVDGAPPPTPTPGLTPMPTAPFPRPPYATPSTGAHVVEDAADTLDTAPPAPAFDPQARTRALIAMIAAIAIAIGVALALAV